MEQVKSTNNVNEANGAVNKDISPVKHGANDNPTISDYESEPGSVKSFEQRLRKKRGMNAKDGKTIHPKVAEMSREMKEFAKKQFELEKNLKIDGIREPPRIRKRRMSVGSNMGRDRESSFKRKRLNSLDMRPRKDHMPKWGLLGGDASDPLNLNGLATSEEGRLLNLKTPENSPLPTPDFRKVVFVKVPPNIEDPLNLEGKHDQRVIDMLLNATRKKRHRSKKNKDGLQQGKDNNPSVTEKSIASEKKVVQEVKTSTESNCQDQKPVSLATNAAKPRRSLSMSPERKLKRQTSGGKGFKQGLNEPTKYPAKPKFTLGNYNRYYGYRNQDNEPDPRLKYFNPLWFENKDVLDIGCNVGHVTLALAEHFCPRKILGIDIDGKLIGAARQNIRHMLGQKRKDSGKYPSVFEITRGPLEAHPLMSSSKAFPNNVLFLQGNYVPGSVEILNLQKEEYDTILALSITKWIHLNNGDHGLKLFFQKIYRQLRPGGRLILEPQPWSTYRKRAKLSAELFKNYASIKLKPEGFKNYLLSIGFIKCEVIGVPVTKAKGFRRPLLLFTKADSHSSISALQSQSDTGNKFRVCTECPSGDQTMCDHIHSTGMRQGAYADRLYNHISYRSSGAPSSDSSRFQSFPSPLLPSGDNQESRKDFPFIPGSSYFRAYSPYSRYSTCSRHSNASIDPELSPSSLTNSSSGSRSSSGSERSWTSATSGSSTSSSTSSGSSSTYSESSRESVNGADNRPVNGNGTVHSPYPVAEIEWVANENADMEDLDDELEEEGAEGLVNGHLSDGEG